MIELTSQRTYASFAMSQLALKLSTALLHTRYHCQSAVHLEDTDLLAKLARDMVALEAKYHIKHLANLYNRARAAAEGVTHCCSRRDGESISGKEQ